MKERLRASDYRFILICAVLLALTTWFSVRNFYRAFPEASIDFKVSRAGALTIDLKTRTISVDGTQLKAGDRIAIDGTNGQVTAEDVPLVEAEVNASFQQVLEWADEIRRLGVRTNAGWTQVTPTCVEYSARSASA